jgi:lipopolysaccharide export system permease protein
MLIARYLYREAVVSFLGIALVLVLVLLSQQFVAYLAKVAAGDMPLFFLTEIMLLSLPHLLSIILPLSIFLAILLAYGRLHSDSEFVVLLTSGVSWGRVLFISLGLAVVVSGIVGYISLHLLPETNKARDELLAKGEASAALYAITPGRFQKLDDGRKVVYAAERQTDGFKGIFIAELPEDGEDNWLILTSKNAVLENDNKKDSFYLILKEGLRYNGTPGNADFTKIKFAEYGREIIPNTVNSNEQQTKNSWQLWNSKDKLEQAEMHWRLALPISVLILVLLAVPLAKINPRDGRFGHILPALMVFIAYFNLLVVSKRWLTSGKITPALGMWWVHGLFLLLGIILLLRASGRWIKWRRN